MSWCIGADGHPDQPQKSDHKYADTERFVPSNIDSCIWVNAGIDQMTKVA